MAHNSYARAAAESYLPERWLAKGRRYEALQYKYLARLCAASDRRLALSGPSARLGDSSDDRRSALFDRSMWPPPEYSDDADLSPEEDKQFRGIRVVWDIESPVRAVDRATGSKLKRRPRRGNLFLHLKSFAGVHELRGRFAVAARYLEANDDQHDAPIVAGVTYRRLGRLVAALGMREMEICAVNDPDYLRQIEAYHMAHCMISGVAPDRMTEFRPMAVYLPTAEFIERFRQADALNQEG